MLYHMVDDSLIGRLQGNQANYLKIKQVEIENNGQKDTYLFFYLSGTKWDDILTNDDVFSEYVFQVDACTADCTDFFLQADSGDARISPLQNKDVLKNRKVVIPIFLQQLHFAVDAGW